MIRIYDVPCSLLQAAELSKVQRSSINSSTAVSLRKEFEFEEGAPAVLWL